MNVIKYQHFQSILTAIKVIKNKEPTGNQRKTNEQLILLY